jgi:hypothetical protein
MTATSKPMDLTAAAYAQTQPPFQMVDVNRRLLSSRIGPGFRPKSKSAMEKQHPASAVEWHLYRSRNIHTRRQVALPEFHQIA